MDRRATLRDSVQMVVHPERDSAPSAQRLPTGLRRTFWVAAALLAAYFAWLLVRPTGAYSTAVDGWGIDVFELALSVICMYRCLHNSWRSHHTGSNVFPLVLGAACLSWAVGDIVLTIESLGGASPSVPSVADGFYLGFYPLCYFAFMILMRRGHSESLLATSLDGIIAGLGVASISAACVYEVMKISGGSVLSVATNMAYPVGDLFLLALTIGGLAILPREFRRFFLVAAVALCADVLGDSLGLLSPHSYVGYVSNGVAWPMALLLLTSAAWVQSPNIKNQSATSEEAATERRAGVALPAIGSLASMGVLFSASLGHLSRAAIALSTTTLLVAGIRFIVTVREARALNSARFRSLIDNAWDIIVVTEEDFEVVYVTQSSQRVLGYEPHDLQHASLIGLIHPDDSETMVDHLRGLAPGSSDTQTFETRMRHQNGEWRVIAWTAANLLADPSVQGYVLNGGDVTEARQVAEDLVAARDAALTASKAKSDFLSTMSHEIRTPMNGVIGLTELLLATTLDEDQLELASGIKVSAENLLEIVNDILDFSKIEAGKLELEEAPVNVHDVANDVGRILAHAAHGKGLELLIDVAPSVPTALLGDAVRIQQLLLNLASNAVKFTFKGEVVIRIVVLGETRGKVRLRFEVVDDGIGIAQSDQERLFAAFSQADSSTTRRFGGTGLGLAICRQLTDLMGGSLGLISAPGEGSTFWFELSLPPTEAVAKETTVDAQGLVGQRALIVDDNATNRKILRHHLISWGIEPVEAVDGFDAMGLAAAAAQAGQPFDLAVVDLNMPGMDGIELAQRLKADPITAHIVLFLLSSSGERLGSAETHRRGFSGSLTKPVRPSDLFDCLITGCNAGIVATPAEGATESKEQSGYVLLVEDNKMNQLVGSKVLAKLGYQFDLANHGIEALEALERRSYDAVLMDCQMPEMDGYAATAEIRRREGSSQHTPIIAMTAAAMEGDREVCLAAGMDDYITKPVRLEMVADVLDRWVNQAPPLAAEPEGASALDGSEPLDATQIEFLRSLDDGDGSLLGEIVEQYLAQALEGRGELARMVGEGDAPALERAAHKLKGASANIGASQLAALCAEIEQQGRLAQLHEAADLVERFDTEFDRVRDALTVLTDWT